MLALKRKVISNDINRVKKYKNNINIKLAFNFWIKNYIMKINHSAI